VTQVSPEEENLCYDPRTSDGLFMQWSVGDADGLLGRLPANAITGGGFVVSAV